MLALIADFRHPEPGFYMVGMKSYGRAPTFLMLTGYEQVRSIAAAQRRLGGSAGGRTGAAGNRSLLGLRLNRRHHKLL